MNDIIAHTLSVYTSSFDVATNTSDSSRRSNVFVNTSPVVDDAPQLPLSVVLAKDASNMLSSTTKRRGRTSPVPTSRLPLKKALSVRWKDQTDGDENAYIEGEVRVVDDEILKANGELLPETDAAVTNIKAKKRSPSPPHLDIKEYEHRMKKLKLSIGEACKSELKFLNQAKHIRDKRSRMVERLKHMKRKAQRFNVLNAQKDHNNSNSSDMDVATTNVSDENVITDNDEDDFVLPPVFREKSTKHSQTSNYIDMTQ